MPQAAYLPSITNSTIKSHPLLSLGSKNACTNAMMLKQGKETSSFVALPYVLLQWKNNRVASQLSAEQKQLRPTPSNIWITSMEFSVALPFATFAWLVEMAEGLVIQEVDELRTTYFRESTGRDYIAIKIDGKSKRHKFRLSATLHFRP